MIICKCGCRKSIPARDRKNRPRFYYPGHHNFTPKEIRICDCGCKREFSVSLSSLKKYALLSCHNKRVGFQKGYIPYNKGLSFIPKNIAIFIENGKKSRFMKGQLAKEKHPLWKGGVTPKNQLIRSSSDYKDWREAVFKRDDFTCVLCSKRGSDLVADHIKSFAYYPELRLQVDNGRTLCKDCNRVSTFVLREWAKA